MRFLAMVTAVFLSSCTVNTVFVLRPYSDALTFPNPSVMTVSGQTFFQKRCYGEFIPLREYILT